MSRRKKPLKTELALLLLIFVANGFFSPVRVGRASWYSRHSPGINDRTANNERFDDTKITCAIWGVPFNSRVLVVNILNGKWVVARVNDRGPHQRFVLQGRVIDLTKAAFERLSPSKKGLAFVVVVRVF